MSAYGVYINYERPKTKKELKAAVKEGRKIQLENVSLFGDGYYDVEDIPEGESIALVGPDPYRARNWFATLTKKADGTLKVE